MKDLIFRRYAELGKVWRAGLSNEVFRASVAFLILTVLFFAIALALPQIREPLVNLVVTAMGSVGAVAEDGSISPTILFFSNLQTCIFIMIYGLIPFLQLPALTLGLNAMVLGVLGAWYAAEGISPLVYLVLLVPHGIFELPALAMALGTGLLVCKQITGRLRKRADACSLSECVVLMSRVLLLALVPLLLIAALIEAYITPLLASLVL